MTEEVKTESPVVTEPVKELEVPVPKPEVVAAPVEVKAETHFQIPKELEELPELIKALSARIEALEKEGKPQTAAVIEQPKELEDNAYFVKVNRKSGIIGR